MKRYILFAWYEGFQSGGMNDIEKTGNNKKKLIKYAKSLGYDYYHVLDILTLDIFYE